MTEKQLFKANCRSYPEDYVEVIRYDSGDYSVFSYCNGGNVTTEIILHEEDLLALRDAINDEFMFNLDCGEEYEDD